MTDTRSRKPRLSVARRTARSLLDAVAVGLHVCGDLAAALAVRVLGESTTVPVHVRSNAELDAELERVGRHHR